MWFYCDGLHMNTVGPIRINTVEPITMNTVEPIRMSTVGRMNTVGPISMNTVGPIRIYRSVNVWRSLQSPKVQSFILCFFNRPCKLVVSYKLNCKKHNLATFQALFHKDQKTFNKYISTLSGQNIRNTFSLHDSGESYDPLLMSLVKSTSISVDEGEKTG
jgi:hypothetical protein